MFFNIKRALIKLMKIKIKTKKLKRKNATPYKIKISAGITMP